jgi:hypothetical protein
MTLSPSDLAEFELARLWGNEGDDIKIHIDGSLPYVILWLTSDSTNRYDIPKPEGVDDVTFTWTFYGDSIDEVIDAALDFARDLAALHPEDES